MSTLTSMLSLPFSFSAQESAAAEGPMISSPPADWYSTFGTGSGSGRAAAASSAAIFGVACFASEDQPPASRMFTKLSAALESAARASSEKSGASCVQATRTSASPSERWKLAASLRQSSVCTVTGDPDFRAAASAAASSGIVLLQLQSFRVLCWIDILPRLFGRLRFVGRFCVRVRGVLGVLRRWRRREQLLAHFLDPREEPFGERLLLRVVVDVGVEAVHDVEVRIGEELLQRRALHRVLDLGMHECLEVRLEGQAV